MFQLCICRDIEHLGSLESTQEAEVVLGITLINLSCSPNFPRTQYLAKERKPKGQRVSKQICPDNENRVQ